MRYKENGASTKPAPFPPKGDRMINHSHRKPPLLGKVKHTRASNASIARILDVVSYGLSWLGFALVLGLIFAGVFGE